MKLKDFFVDLIETVILSILLLAVIYWLVASIDTVSGGSMEPNLQTNERVLVNILAKYSKSFTRGDIIVLNPPHDLSKRYIKRIIGMPGDIVKVFECRVYISNSSGKYVLNEPYLSNDVCTRSGSFLKEGRAVKLEAGEYLVLGDNRDYSLDSRNFGVITDKNIVGKAILVVWPPQKLGYIK